MKAFTTRGLGRTALTTTPAAGFACACLPARARERTVKSIQLSDTVTTTIRAGTGGANGPVSTNAMLGSNGAFSKSSLYLDRGYVAIKPDGHTTVEAGRSSNPFSTTDILFYSELGFDCVSAHYEHGVAPRINGFVTGGAFPLFNTELAFSSNNPNKYASTDSYLFAIQGDGDWKIRKDLIARLGVGFFDFVGVQGAISAPCSVQQGTTSTYACSSDDTWYLNGQFGNTLYAIRNLVASTATGVNTTNPPDPQYYGLVSRFAMLDVHPRFDIDTYAPYDIQIEGDFIKDIGYSRSTILNHGAPSQAVGPVNNLGTSPVKGQLGPYQGSDTGYMVKLTVGYPVVKHRWDWNAYAAYKHIETDATLDSLNDSEFHLGGTNARNYVLGAELGLADNTLVSLKWFTSQVISGALYGNDVVLLDLNSSF